MQLKRMTSYWNKPEHVAYLFIAPTGILLFVFCIIPLVASFFLSTMKVGVNLGLGEFIGLDNYVKAFTDRRFIDSLRVTIKFSVIETFLQMVIGIAVSAFIANNSFFNRMVRSIYFLPVITSAVTVGIMWQMILHPSIGLFTYWMEKIGLNNVALLNNPDTALYTLMGISIWRNFGISAIILVAAIQNVPKDYYEAAELDGAGKIKQFFAITLPEIKSSIWYLLISRVIGSLQVFDIVYTLTNGGPNNSTRTTVFYIYGEAFSKNNNMGYASAMSEILFGMIMIVIIVLQHIERKTSD